MHILYYTVVYDMLNEKLNQWRNREKSLEVLYINILNFESPVHDLLERPNIGEKILAFQKS